MIPRDFAHQALPGTAQTLSTQNGEQARSSIGSAVMRRFLIVLLCIACGYCGSQSPTAPTPGPPPTNPPPSQPPAGPQIFVGAGDIAMCDVNSVATAALLDSIGGLIFT